MGLSIVARHLREVVLGVIRLLHRHLLLLAGITEDNETFGGMELNNESGTLRCI